MKQILLCAASVVAVLSSCSKNEVITNLETADNAVSFGVYTGITGRAATQPMVDTEAIQTNGFYLFGYYNDGAAFATSSTPDFMYNQKVTYDNSSWSYTPVKYWSEDEADTYSFFAYAPEVKEKSFVSSFPSNSSTGTPKITFTLSDLTDMVDFVADARIDVTSQKDDTNVGDTSAAKVEFKLLHETTRVGITAKTNITSTTGVLEDKTHVIVKAITIKDDESTACLFAKKATYTFDATDTGNTAADTRGVWSDFDYSADAISLTSLLNKNNDAYGTDYAANTGVDVVNGKSTATDLLATTADGKTTTDYLFLIPANSGTSKTTATLEVTYDILTEDSQLAKTYTLSKDNVKSVTIPSGLFERGTAYNLELTFSLNEVTVSATVANWTTESETLSNGIEK